MRILESAQAMNPRKTKPSRKKTKRSSVETSVASTSHVAAGIEKDWINDAVKGFLCEKNEIVRSGTTPA
jgi:hypothetical protein